MMSIMPSKIGCQPATDLDLAIIDRSDCHAIALLSALRGCRHDLPVVVMTSSQSCHCAAIAYANGAAACLAKPIAAADLKVVFRQPYEPKLKFDFA
jgi:DNA-binding NtrC family response regulator